MDCLSVARGFVYLGESNPFWFHHRGKNIILTNTLSTLSDYLFIYLPMLKLAFHRQTAFFKGAFSSSVEQLHL